MSLKQAEQVTGTEKQKTTIFAVEIPLPNYYGNGVYFQPLYLRGTRSPTKEQVLVVLKQLHDRDSQFQGEYIGTWDKAAQIVLHCDDFPVLGGNLVHTNTHVVVPGFKNDENPINGKWPLSVSKLEILEIPNLQAEDRVNRK